MGLPQLREEVENLMKRADERLLKMVYALAVTYDKDEIVAYTTSGTPLTKEAYMDEMEAARKEVKEGNTITTSALKDRVNSWKEKYNK